MHFPQIHGGLSGKGSPFGGAGEEQGDETERARLLTENHRRCDSIALTKSLPIAAPAALSCRACPLRHCFAMPPPLPRGGLGSPRKVNGFARGSPTRGNGDDRRQWRKQGGAVGAAASKTQAERGGCWEPQPGLGERSETERLYEGEPFLCRKVRLLAFSVSFWRKEWYNGFAVHPAYLTGEEVDALAYFLTFLVSVGADVVSHFICKWLDRYEENRKA